MGANQRLEENGEARLVNLLERSTNDSKKLVALGDRRGSMLAEFEVTVNGDAQVFLQTSTLKESVPPFQLL